MFFGEYFHSIDPKKNRIIIPAKFRAALGDKFIFTKGFHKCLYVFTLKDWDNFLENINIPMTDERGQRFNRLFFSSAFESEQDGSGRVLIPANLREYAGLTDEIVSIGVKNRIEIWNQDDWQSYCADSSSVVNPTFIDAGMQELLSQLGI